MYSREYLAGLFDGEGFITFTWRKDQNYLKCDVGISMSEHDFLEKLQEQFENSRLYNKGKSKLGTKETWMFRIAGSYANEFVDYIYPHVILKKRDLDFFYEWSELPKAQPRNMKAEVMEAREAFHGRYKQFRATK